MSYEEQTLLYQGKAVDAKKRVLTAFKSIKKKDFIIICGASDSLRARSWVSMRCPLPKT